MSNATSGGVSSANQRFLGESQFREKLFKPFSGWLMIPVWIFLLLFSIAMFVGGVKKGEPPTIILAILIFLGLVISLAGFFVVGPNESRVLVLFGHYRGTVRKLGFHWTNPFTRKTRVSLRVRTFETGSSETEAVKDAAGKIIREATRSRHPVKVNDLDGNPIDIAAIVVWRVVDTAEALFAVQKYEQFVEIQSESALRNLASRFHYDYPDAEGMSLRGSTDQVGAKLKEELEGRLGGAGIEVLESRISCLSYAPEIASAMLQRQQASAFVAARFKIVEGAVGMVELALEQIAAKKLAVMTPEQKAQIVSNLLVVLVSDRGAHPVVQIGNPNSA
ncbi:MAG: SPFH domain-containing protein [Planctomycetes bacterium]|nr:SPFH domain-containing protein [Planctomycetota bacterium]